MGPPQVGGLSTACTFTERSSPGPGGRGPLVRLRRFQSDCHGFEILFPSGEPPALPGWQKEFDGSGVSICCNLTVSTRPLTATPLPLFPLPGEKEEGRRGERV